MLTENIKKKKKNHNIYCEFKKKIRNTEIIEYNVRGTTNLVYLKIFIFKRITFAKKIKKIGQIRRFFILWCNNRTFFSNYGNIRFVKHDVPYTVLIETF